MKHKHGDHVTIRDWDDLTREFKITSVGSLEINENIIFNKHMRQFCGKTLKVKGIPIGENYSLYGCGDWRFSDEMFTDWGKINIDKER